MKVVDKTEIYEYLKQGYTVRALTWPETRCIFLNGEDKIQNEEGFIWTPMVQRLLKEAKGFTKLWEVFGLEPSKEEKPKDEEYVYKRKSLLNWNRK